MLTVALINVGYYLSLVDDEDHKSIAKELGYTKPETGIDGSEYDERYALTHLG